MIVKDSFMFKLHLFILSRIGRFIRVVKILRWTKTTKVNIEVQLPAGPPQQLHVCFGNSGATLVDEAFVDQFQSKHKNKSSSKKRRRRGGGGGGVGKKR